MIAPTKGFTLFELVLTLLLVSLLAGLAIPSLAGTLARQRQSVEINALFHAVHLARKESIMRKKVVSLCPTRDGKVCTPSRDWSTGWLMFENRDRDSPPQIDSGEPLLLTHQIVAPVRISANRTGFTFRATFLRATNGTIVLCDPEDRITPKALVVSYTGRPRVARHSPDGELYSCAD
jgi:type IV fimbrial biogenesis protein FimT